MTTENSISEEIKFVQPECQTLDSLLQNSCETCQSEVLDANICETKSMNNTDLCPKRSWTESIELYISTLKPKDTLIFIENIKVFSKGTVYMSDFRNYYFDNILKFLNGGEPLKTDFGRDEFTSLYSLYSFSPVSNENKVECIDTPMIFKVMESMDVLNFDERNPKKQLSNMRTILNEAKNIFQCYDKIRNNHPKRKRYLIFVTCSDLLLDDICDLVNDMKSMKVRFSLFSPVKYDSHTNICNLLNYNNKGCKDLSCYYQSSKWSVILTHGLTKAFESTSSCQILNKKMKWNPNKEACDTTEYDFIMMNLVNVSNSSQASENIPNHVQVDIETSLNSSLSGRSLTNNDQLEQNYGQSNINYNSTLAGTSQSTLTHSKSQSKFMQSSNTSYYQSGSINQSQMTKVNSMPCYYFQDQLYSAPNSVSVSSHRSTPSSIPHSQSPQFNMGNTHPNLVQQSNSVSEVIKPSSVESCNEIHSHLNSQKSIQMNPEVEMVPSLQRFPYAMMNSSNNMINPNNNINPNRFVFQPLYKSNVDPRTNNITLFEGYLIYSEDKKTDIVLCIDQNINLNLFSMDSWDHQCSIYYVNYFDSYAASLYGKNADMDLISKDNVCKASVELQIIMNPEAIKTICNTVATKPNYTMAILRSGRSIPPDVHVQIICFIFSKSLPTNFKVIIPADPKSLFNEIKSRMGPMSNTSYSNQSNQLYPMKRGNVPNQVYNIPQAMAIPRQMINRYNSHNTATLSMMGNQVYRNISHPPNFMNNQQLPANSNYIMHSGQYSSLPNQSSNHLIPMDMGLQSNQNMYDQNNY